MIMVRQTDLHKYRMMPSRHPPMLDVHSGIFAASFSSATAASRNLPRQSRAVPRSAYPSAMPTTLELSLASSGSHWSESPWKGLLSLLVETQRHCQLDGAENLLFQMRSMPVTSPPLAFNSPFASGHRRRKTIGTQVVPMSKESGLEY